ncbi:MAG: serine/threonine protein phosphatase, partial [Cytophagales bacterium CG18_big_fil_WC_8_21_14_2_50_42_9]
MRYTISDIHGCANTFRHLVNEVIQLKPTDELFLLGDYIDRGPDSKGVIDFIQELQKSGIQVRTLSGNHEAMMLDALEDPEYFNHWMLNGGKQTLASFGVKSIREIPQSYWLFLRQLEYYIELEDYLLVHAGFNFKAEDPFTDTHSMLWI